MLEREPRIAAHQTGHSSGVIHSGIYYAPGSLKARLCVAGAQEMYDYCAERGIAAARTGKLIVATGTDSCRGWPSSSAAGTRTGSPDLRRLDPAEAREFEPHAAGLAALHSPSTGVVDFAAVAGSFAADLARAGGTRAPGCAVESLERRQPSSHAPGHDQGAGDDRLRRRLGRPARGRGRGAAPSPGSSPSAAPTCGCAPSAPTWCGRASTRCPTRSCRSSAPT